MSAEVYIHGVKSVSIEYTDFDDPSFTVCDITVSSGDENTIVKLFLPTGARPIPPT